MVRTPVQTLRRRQWVPGDLHDTFAFFERPENLARITPPWLDFRIVTPGPIRMRRGLTIDYTLRVAARWRWRSLITEYDPPHAFRDVQVRGPYRTWDHRHRFWSEAGGTVVEDEVVYQLPGGPLGTLLHRLAVRRKLDAIFDFRREQIALLLAAPGTSAVASWPS